MLNLSKNDITKYSYLEELSTVDLLKHGFIYKLLNKVLLGSLVIVIISMFLPWTQNISGEGVVTTLKPNQRPQTIQSIISGKVEKWYVQEGDYVEAGDTILFISEIKENYLDPDLVENTKAQLEAKTLSAESYTRKISALKGQFEAIQNERDLKVEQAKNKIIQAGLKIKSDSINLEAVKTQLKIAVTQFNRATQLNKEGLKPLTDVEEKRLKLQESEAKIITQENKLLGSKNDLINAQVELGRVRAEYDEKLSKSQSDQYSAVSGQYEAQVEVNKLKNSYANYSIRNGMYYIKAPQSGYINRALQSGVGETVKEGTAIVSIMPKNYEIAVETYISPMDFPLIKKGEEVRVWFDGWPTIVFSGWPGLSPGTFAGKVVAIENYISANGKYRVLIAPNETEPQWPAQLSIGSGANTIALLNNVPIWYEIWRTLNGFPPDYYQPKTGKNVAQDKK